MGGLLVALQFLFFITLLIMAASGNWNSATAGLSVILVIASVLTGLWSLYANRPGNFGVMPTPKTNAQLVTHGPYRWIRHPMYTSVLLLGLACVAIAPGLWAVVVWVALYITLEMKSRFEEKLLINTYPDYVAYMSRTGRFIPGLF